MIQDLIKSLRASDLEKLRNGLFSSGVNSQPQCFILTGSKGIGRKALIQQLREGLDSDGEAILWVDPSRLKDEPDLEKYHNLIPQCIKTNIALLKSRADQAAIEIGREMYKADAQAMQDNSGKEKETPAQVWGRVFKEHFLALNAQEAGASDKTKAIILIENFETYNGQQQLWLKEFLFDQLQQTCPADQIAYIITTTPEEGKNIQKFFPSSNFKTETIPLKPLSEEEIEELLLQLSLTEVSLKDFYAQTNGIPSKVEELANSLLHAEVDPTSMSNIEAFLAGKTEEQLQWITVAVHLPEFSEEGLRLYLDDGSTAKAFEWLGNQSQLIKEEVSGEKSFQLDLKNALIRWMRNADPEQFKTLSEISSKYTKIVRKFNNPMSRTYLDHLSCLNYFSSEDLKYIFEDTSDEYVKFVTRNPQYFEQGTGKHRVKSQFQELVQTYRELVPSTASETLCSKAQEFWDVKSSDLQNRVQNLKAKKSVEEAKLGELLQQRSTLEVFLENDEEEHEKEALEKEEQAKAEKLKKIQEEKQAEVDRKVKRSRLLHNIINLLLLAGGVASFYFGLFSKETAVVPMIFGVFLIVLGFRPFRSKVTIKTSKIESKVDKEAKKAGKNKNKKTSQKGRKGDKVEEEAPMENEDLAKETFHLDEDSGARYVLEFKRQKLTSKEEEIQSRIEDLNKTLKELEQKLSEPLVA